MEGNMAATIWPPPHGGVTGYGGLWVLLGLYVFTAFIFTNPGPRFIVMLALGRPYGIPVPT